MFGKIVTEDLAVLNDHELDLNTSMMYRHEDYVDAYQYIDAHREETMKVLIDVDETEK